MAATITADRSVGGGIGLAVAAMATIQLGAALSEPLFDRVGPAGVVALRLGIAALILWPFARPRLRGRSRADLGAAAALGRAAELGVEVKIVTGDARPRAGALARQIGIDVPDNAIIAAGELSGRDIAAVALSTVDLDAAGRELHRHCGDAGQAPDLLLDRGDTARAAEALGAEDGAGGGGVAAPERVEQQLHASAGGPRAAARLNRGQAGASSSLASAVSSGSTSAHGTT